MGSRDNNKKKFGFHNFTEHRSRTTDLEVRKFYFIIKLVITVQEDLFGSILRENAVNVANLARLHIDIRILRDC